MRAAILAVLCEVALAPTPLQAAPVPTKATLAKREASPPVELAAQGCGWGRHRRYWRDHWDDSSTAMIASTESRERRERGTQSGNRR
jgi:hypothetical protein